MKIGTPRNADGTAIGLSPGSRPAIDANHVLVYLCNETGGTTLADSASGGARPATLTGTADTDYTLNDFGLYVRGTPALRFAGTSGGYARHNGNSLAFAASVSLEATVCVAWKQAAPTSQFLFQSTGTGSSEISIDLLVESSVPKIRFSATDASANGSYVKAAVNAQCGARMHIGAVYTPGVGSKLYVNGALFDTGALLGSSGTITVDNYVLGNIAGTYDRAIAGCIADVRLSNVARSQAYFLAAAKAAGAL